MHALKERDWETLKRLAVKFPTDRPACVNLGPSDKLKVKVCEKIPCITSRGKYYLTHRCRLMQPVEVLRMLNIWYDSAIPKGEDTLLQNFSGNFIMDVAANAMEGVCFSASIVALLVVVSHGEAGWTPQATLAKPADVSEDDISDDEMFSSVWRR